MSAILDTVIDFARGRDMLAERNSATGRCTWFGTATRVMVPDRWLVDHHGRIYDPREWAGIDCDEPTLLMWAVFVDWDSDAARLVLRASSGPGRHELRIRSPGFGAWRLMDGARLLGQCDSTPTSTNGEVARSLFRQFAPPDARLYHWDTLLVDAWSPWVDLPADGSATLECIKVGRPGDPASRDELAVLADRLQAEGHHAGEWLALWLAGEVEWIGPALGWIRAQTMAASSPCDYCDDTGVVTVYPGEDGRPMTLAGPGLVGGERRPCPECRVQGC